jgi:hypothetical protein
MLEPAFAVLTGARFVSTISSCVEPHVPLVIVQRSVALVPTGMSVIVVVGEFRLVIVAVPLWRVQVPTPTAAELPVMVNVSTSQLLLLAGPASATVGGSSLVSVISATLVGQEAPFVTVQCITTKPPAATPVTVVVGDVGFVIVAVPVTVQRPVPIVGAAAAMRKVPLLH